MDEAQAKKFEEYVCRRCNPSISQDKCDHSPECLDVVVLERIRSLFLLAHKEDLVIKDRMFMNKRTLEIEITLPT